RVMGEGIFSPASVKSAAVILSAPDNHFAAGPDCCVKVSGSGRVGQAGWRPGVPHARGRLVAVSAAGVEINRAVPSAPDDHLAPSPHCRVRISTSWRVGGAGGCPTIGARVVSTPGVRVAAALSASAPDDHLAAGPHCRVTQSGSGAAGSARGCPTVAGWGVYSASVI